MGQDSVRSIHDIERSVTGASHKGPSDDHNETCSAADTVSDAPREFGLRIGRDGTWYYLNSPIQRMPLVKLFATVLRRDDEGRFWLVTPVERGIIHVDDAPFVAVDVDIDPPEDAAGPDATLTFRTNLDETVVAGPDHPIRLDVDRETGEPAPYVMVRDRLEALINRATYYRLAEMAVESADGSGVLGVWSGGVFFPLGRAE
ncbi:hypothetical protein SAMN05660686_00665 [Thalassobaculum litoreum DSM 18839]|mgnify:CR=1 FL=1|uniref:Proteophosphoglycan n=1 Tax=Thalassobaculum litoreum DSM 18839 TaxID=1123362 RepID=A0A8G2EXI3_9PROT|nr:hypothetical protein SAMN05660686_00665 [Thalassobaculum litoreum DSM 18839]